MTRKAPLEELLRANLVRFREEAGLSQAKAADLSGVPLDNLRRYETGTSGVGATVLKQLADAYGHNVGDFYSPDPPAADLESRPVYFLRTRPDAEYSPETYAKLQKLVDEMNHSEIEALRAKKKTKKKS